MGLGYRLLSCARTYELYEQFKDEYGVYVPVEFYETYNERTKERTRRKRAAFPGYAFAPAEHAATLIRKAPQWYHIRGMYTKIGTPYWIKYEDLHLLQQNLLDDFNGGTGALKCSQEAEPQHRLALGDKVRLVFSAGVPVGDHLGTLKEFKSGNRARVDFGGLFGFATVPIAYLSKEN